MNNNTYISYSVFLILFILILKDSLKHGLVKDQYTIGGCTLGLILSLAFPIYHSHEAGIKPFLNSLSGCLTGLIVLWGILELGKLLYGNRKIQSSKTIPVCFYKHLHNNEYVLDIGGEETSIEDFFYREKDQVVIDGKILITLKDSKHNEGMKLVINPRCLILDNTRIDFENLGLVTASADKILLPREVIGFGVVKLGALVGTFVGFPGIIYCILGTLLLQTFTVVFVLIVTAGKSSCSTNQVAPFMFLITSAWVLYSHFRIF
jgi:hypothetical protein